MGHWNYRLVVTAQDPAAGRDLTICEVYYDDAGQPMGYTDRAPGTSDLQDGQPSSILAGELTDALSLMESAIHRTILRVEDGRLVDTGEQL